LAELRLGQEAEVAGGGQGDVRERDRQRAALAGAGAPALGPEQTDRRVEPAGDVPGRQHVVDRVGVPGRAGQQREAEPGVDRVVDGGAAVRVALDLQVDQVRPAL